MPTGLQASPTFDEPRPGPVPKDGAGGAGPVVGGGADEGSAADRGSRQSKSPWLPLKNSTFRIFWVTSVISNIGTWLHEVGAGWLMTTLDSSPEMVSSVRVAMTVPMVLLALPAGVLADRLDRRKLMIFTQLALFASTAALATMTIRGSITAPLLLWLTLSIGICMVLHVLTWQATTPELVPPEQLARAVALGSISFNLARAVGPALGGVLIAVAGSWLAFAINAWSFAATAAVLVWWKRATVEAPPRRRYGSELAEGVAYVIGDEKIRPSLIHLFGFVMPSAAMWSLLPLYAREQLLLGPDGYGLLVAALGVGAVTAASQLHRVQHRFGFDGAILISKVGFAIAFLIASRTTYTPLALACLLVMGGGWMMTVTTLNSNVQLALPGFLRGRGMSCYVTVMAFSMASGSFLWGRVAGIIGVPETQFSAALMLLAAAALLRLNPIRRSSPSPAAR